MLDRIEANGPHAQGCLHRDMQIVQFEGLHQSQDLDIFPASGFDHPRFHQPSQGLELGR